MKHCPRCQKNYEADDLNFCLDDGTPLITGVSPAAPTMAMHSPPATALPGHAGTVPYIQPQLYASQQPAARPGMKIWPFMLLGLVVLLCGGGLAGIFVFSRLYTAANPREPGRPISAPPSASASPAAATDKSSEGGRITIENFNKLKTGMSRSEVEVLLGKGEQVSSVSGGGHTYSVDSWIDEDFRSIILTFDNDKLSTKTQSGLDD